MSHFARVVNGIVQNVIVADQDFINAGHVGDPAQWIQTSYNTYHGRNNVGGTPLRKNFAGVGYTYDKDRDAFIPPKPFASWHLNEQTCDWEPPIALPDDRGIYRWNESKQNWDIDHQLLKFIEDHGQS